MADLKLNKNGTLIEVTIKSSGEEWTSLTKKAKEDLFATLEVKGFRPGNVPANIAEQHISEGSIWNKAADLLIEGQYSAAIELLSKERIATRPTFKINSVSNDGIEAVLSSIAMPEIKLGNRDSINVEYKVNEVTEEELNNEVSQLEELLQAPQTVEDEVKDGDIINMDFVGSVDGTNFEGGAAEGFDLQIGSKQFIDGFEEQLVGTKAGDKKTVTVTFPEEYPSEDLKGKEAKFEVTVNAVKRNVKLEGEALQAKLKEFGFESKDEIVKRIKEVAADRKVQEAQDNYFKNYVEAVAELSDTVLTLPEEIVKSEVDVEFQRVQQQVAQQGMKMDDYLKMLGMDEKTFKENTLVESSKKRIRDGLIYQQLIDDLEIKAEEADFEEEYAKLAKDSKASVEDVKKQIQPQSVESNIIFNKLVKALIK